MLTEVTLGNQINLIKLSIEYSVVILRSLKFKISVAEVIFIENSFFRVIVHHERTLVIELFLLAIEWNAALKFLILHLVIVCMLKLLGPLIEI